MKKQITALLTAAALCAAAAPLSVSAADSAEITVTIANAGTLAVTAEALAVTDADGDGALTVNDALLLTHDSFYDGGADAGYTAAQSDWGLSITKLWGVENGGSYGYTVNDAFAFSLTDPLTDGDALYAYAYAYADAETYSDMYSYFDQQTKDGLTQGDSLTLKLSAIGYDADWNQVIQPVEGAVITVNGEQTAFTTDADGNVTLTLDASGDVTISAVSDTATLVPPVFRAAVAAAPAETDETGDNGDTSETTVTTTSETAAASSTPAPPATGDKTVPALCVTGLLALGAAFVLRRRDDA